MIEYQASKVSTPVSTSFQFPPHPYSTPSSLYDRNISFSHYKLTVSRISCLIYFSSIPLPERLTSASTLASPYTSHTFFAPRWSASYLKPVFRFFFCFCPLETVISLVLYLFYSTYEIEYILC